MLVHIYAGVSKWLGDLDSEEVSVI
jgi:hypothetical protein